MKIYFKLFCFLYSCTFFAQLNKNCGQNIAYTHLFQYDPSAKAKYEALSKIPTNSDKTLAGKSSPASYTIPVVFHVLHKGGQENISDAQIKDAVAILNRDFRKLNADTSIIVPQFQSLAADCSIQFSLATIDDNGNCTNGITRHYDNRTDWSINISDYVYTWNPAKYLNIYVVRKLPNGVAGYAYLPGTAPVAADAIVILNNYVGSIETGNVYTSRALTHEVGHWFNLNHVWGNTNQPGVTCGDDGVGDTPVTKGHGSCDLGNAIECTPGIVENIQNYMEYSYCCTMYTQGQRTRMHNCLNSGVANRVNLWSNSNLIATGVINPDFNCAPKAEYIYNTNISCVGSALSFIDQSYNAPVSTWEWSSPLAANISTLQNGILSFTGSGVSSVQLKVGNGFGKDSINKQLLTVLAAGTTSGNIGMTQGFENGIFPDNKWIASTPQYGSPFTKTNQAAATGSNCVWVNNYFDNPNGTVTFYSPAFNLQNCVFGLMNFKYAYAQQSTANNDVFKVYVSTNCGTSWTSVYSASGTSLSTTGSPVAGPFLNPTANQWKTQIVNLLPYSSNSKVYFKFEFTPDINGAGNNFYIDDININTLVGLHENSADLNAVSIYPNPFNSDISIQNDGTEPIKTIKVFDISSRLLKEIKVDDMSAKKMTITLSDLGSGVYFVELKSQRAAKMVKIIKE